MYIESISLAILFLSFFLSPFPSPHLPTLPSKNPDLHRPTPQIRHRGKRKRERKPHIPAPAIDSNSFTYGAREPHLGHAEHGTGGADAGGGDGGDAGG